MRTVIDRARDFAIAAHGNQVRKYTGEPYWHHLREVVHILEIHVDWRRFSRYVRQDMLAAAWLHDTVEDTPVTRMQISREFGFPICELVHDLTDVSKPEDGNRAARKALDRAHLAKASPEAKTIKLADLVSNTTSIRLHDPKFAEVYLAEKRLLLPHLQEGDPSLLKLATELAA